MLDIGALTAMEAFAELTQAINRFDFSDAALKCERLMHALDSTSAAKGS